jgi:hypothetical protein
MLKTNNSKVLGNSIKSDLGFGKSAAFSDFNSSYKTSDFNNTTVNSSYAQLLSLNSFNTSQLSNNFNFGGNKLIARKATSLITSQKLINLDKSVVDYSSQSMETSNLIENYLNFTFETTYPTKPSFINHQLTFFSSLSNFQNALNYLNYNDNQLVNNTLITNDRHTLINQTVLNTESVDFFKNPYGNTKQLTLLKTLGTLSTSTYPAFSLIADQDFKR